jgi:hypothetical protein
MQRGVGPGTRCRWTPAQEAKLLAAVKRLKGRRPNWRAIARAVGREARACMMRHRLLRATPAIRRQAAERDRKRRNRRVAMLVQPSSQDKHSSETSGHEQSSGTHEQT